VERAETPPAPAGPSRPAAPRSVPIASAAGPLSASVWALLSPLPVAESVYRHHYRQTVRSLGNERLAAAEGLSGMLDELAALRDTGPGRAVPYGLIEFLLRLCAERELAAPIAAWLQEHAGRQGHDQENARRRIADEAGRRVLVVRVDHGDQGEVSGFQWFLRTADLGPVPGVAAGPNVAVAGWRSFPGALRATLDTLAETHAIGEVQFVVDPPLFDRPFHAIPTATATLGEDYVVLVRFRARLCGKAVAPMHRAWRAWADGLRGCVPAALGVLPIPAPGPGGGGPITREVGVRYARYPVRRAPSSPETLTLARWLCAGAPYLVWPHEDPPGGDWQGLEDCLRGCLEAATALAQVPAEWTGSRLRQEPAARQATLLWDHPDYHPF
jgi:hypothetical protein